MSRRVLVVGFGRTGQAVARILAARGDRVRAGDRRDAGALKIDPRALAGVELHASDGPELLESVDLVVPKPVTLGRLRQAISDVLAMHGGEASVSCGSLGPPVV